MPNNIDEQYIELLKDILSNGIEKGDRTGTGTISVFGRQLRHDMSLGFPLLTTKKMAYKSIFSELQWFLLGRSDLRWLLEHNNTIWVGDAYKKYCKEVEFYFSRTSDVYETEVSSVDNVVQEAVPYTKKEFIEKIKSDDSFSKKFGYLGPIYGHQWRSWNMLKWTKTNMLDPTGEAMVKWNIVGLDQISNLIRDLENNPDSRRMMVNAWNVAEIDEMTLPPCHYGFQVWTKELTNEERYRYWFDHNYETGFEFQPGQANKVDYDNPYWTPTPKRKISLMWNQRSVDTPLGLPFNIASYALLLEIIAKRVNMIPDELICNLGDTHIYKNQVDAVKEQISRTPKSLPKIVELDVNENLTFDLNSIRVENYDPHPTIKYELSN